MDRQPGLENSNHLEKVTFNLSFLTPSNIHHHRNILNSEANRKIVKVVRCSDGLCASVRPVCDWSNTNILLANRKQEKRKGEDMKVDNWRNTKKRRPGVNS